MKGTNSTLIGLGSPWPLFPFRKTLPAPLAFKRIRPTRPGKGGFGGFGGLSPSPPLMNLLGARGFWAGGKGVFPPPSKGGGINRVFPLKSRGKNTAKKKHL
eukprot:FR734808.1.p2 GENE.FR734808.1~~FR734808.1.p2  ORF type:complete len:101 (+),score=35.14 FR734808.1:818-1120(+)